MKISRKQVQIITAVAGILTIVYTGLKLYDEYITKKDNEEA